MRGKRSSGYWGIGSEFDNWVDGRCVACLGRRAGRVGEMMLNSLGFGQLVFRWGVGLRLAFGMVLRIVIFEHWGWWIGREIGEREDRAFWDRIKAMLLSRSLSNAITLTTATVFSRWIVISIAEPYEA